MSCITFDHGQYGCGESVWGNIETMVMSKTGIVFCKYMRLSFLPVLSYYARLEHALNCFCFEFCVGCLCMFIFLLLFLLWLCLSECIY